MVFNGTYPIDTCALDVELTDDDSVDDDDTADDDAFADLTNYVKRSCSSDDFVFPDAPNDDDDGAYTVGAGFAWAVALIAGLATYASTVM